jgi:Protein of unknown function (DUF2630)
MADEGIQGRIEQLVAEEHELLGASDETAPADRHARLERIGVELDQCWDLLRQRRARREFGQDPDDAQTRDEGTVEHYLQ